MKGIHYGITEIFNEKTLKKCLFTDKMTECACLCVYRLYYRTCDYV